VTPKTMHTSPKMRPERRTDSGIYYVSSRPFVARFSPADFQLSARHEWSHLMYYIAPSYTYLHDILFHLWLRPLLRLQAAPALYLPCCSSISLELTYTLFFPRVRVVARQTFAGCERKAFTTSRTTVGHGLRFDSPAGRETSSFFSRRSRT
jgi:hypothetical protein